jgi:CO/xanthine dehydrogenase Mo-binding subunit
MSSDGSVVLLTGTVEVGQGPRTALSQVVAEELALS